MIDIFPGICPIFARKLLLQHKDRPSDAFSLALDHLLTLPVHPKSDGINTKVFFFKTDLYKLEAIRLLEQSFPEIKLVINRIFESYHECFIESFLHLRCIYKEKAWLKWFSVLALFSRERTKINGTFMLIAKVIDKDLCRDIAALNRIIETEMTSEDYSTAVSLNFLEYEIENQLMDCQCCAKSAAMEEFATCGNGHLVCFECCSFYLKEVIYGRYESLENNIPCLAAFDTGYDGHCAAHVGPAHLERLGDLYRRYHRHVRERNITKIAMENPDTIVRCKNPLCQAQYFDSEERSKEAGSFSISVSRYLMILSMLIYAFLSEFLPNFAAIMISAAVMLTFYWRDIHRDLTPSSPTSWFKCLECGLKSCRHCTASFKSCHDCETSSKGNLRKLLEDAMTEAVIRRCPKCKVNSIFRDFVS